MTSCETSIKCQILSESSHVQWTIKTQRSSICGPINYPVIKLCAVNNKSSRMFVSSSSSISSRSVLLKTLNISNLREKIKSLLLNILGKEDNYLNVNYLTEYFVKLTWCVVYASSCNFSLFQITKSPVLEFICKVFLSVYFCISFLVFFLM